MTRTRNVVRLALAAAVVAALALVAAAPVGAGGEEEVPEVAAPLTIEKVVSGPQPAAGFTVLVECDSDIIETGEGESTSAVVTFGPDGTPTSGNVFGFDSPGTCTVREVESAGAATVSYACEGSFADEEEYESPCDAVSSSGVTVLIVDEDQEATVTVTNTFVPPAPVEKPAETVVVPAKPLRFTG